MYVRLQVKYPVILSDFNLNLLDRFFGGKKNSQISDFLTFLLVGGELLRADRQTDMTKHVAALFAILRTRQKRKMLHMTLVVDKKNQLDVTFCILYFSMDALPTNRT